MDIQLAKKGLSFSPHAIATSVWAALGNRGSGKSNLAAVIAEGILDAGLPVIVIDSVGPWFSLRLAPDGKSPSRFQIPVLGGTHGDIPLLPTAGRQVAEALAASASSAVLDISMMGKGERTRFAADFGEAFFEAKKRNPGPVCLVLEEAQRLVPQVVRQVNPDIMRCLGAFEEMFEVGRNFGIGGGLLSLRPQKVNKDVLNLAETVFAFRATGALERKAIEGWVQEKDAPGRGEVSGELPSLKKGCAIVWSPSLFEVYGQFQLLLKSTYDASSTPDAARAAVKMKSLDLAQLQSKMDKVVEEAKANDPRLLRARIAELERAAAKGYSAVAAPVKVVATKVVERRMLSGVDIKRLEVTAQRFEALCVRLDQMRTVVSNDVKGLLDAMAEAKRANVTVAGTSPLEIVLPSPRAFVKAVVDSLPTSTPSPLFLDSDGKPLSRCARALLVALAEHQSSTSRSSSDGAVSAISGYRITSSSFGNGMSELRVRGFVEGSPDARVITAAGRAAAGPVGSPLAGESLVRFWVNKLGGCPGKMLVAVYQHGTVTREQLSVLTGYRITSSSFGNGISELKTLGLVRGPAGGDLAIADVFA